MADDITARTEERLLRFLAPELRNNHTRSRDIRKPLTTTGIIISLDITQLGTGALRVFFQFRDNQGNYKNIFQSVAVNSVGQFHYLIDPNAVVWPGTAVAEIFVSPIPTVSAVEIRHTNPGSDFEYSVHGQFI